MQLNPYLSFDGRCKEAFDFYAHCLGGTVTAMMTYEGSPMADQCPPEFRDKVMHARLDAGGTIVMGSDAPPGRYEAAKGFHVTIGMEDAAEAGAIFTALADGGTVQMPLQSTFWSAGFGMLVDRFGIPWMVNCEPAG